ncbi:CHASE3 domain-containing protein [Terrimonas alba]|uniref:CHASE3 domain-containing protein n=1 Tax=Terrimonas alba TaxID=3349636 RepID=UPI0035F420E5
MKLIQKIKNRWGYILAFLLLLVSYFLIFYIIEKLAQETDAVSQSYSTINNLESIKAEITDAETGIRGYVITKDVRYLKPYNSGSKNVRSYYQNLRNTIHRDDIKKAKLDTLGLLINKRLKNLSDFLVNFQRSGFVIKEEILASKDENKKVMDDIRNLVYELKENEQNLMKRRNENLRDFYTSTAILAIISLLTALVTIFYSLITYTKENKAKEEADRNAKIYSLELEERLNELNKANKELDELRLIEKFAVTGRIARTIAHEVRNPLTNISLATEQIRDLDGQGHEDASLLLNMIERNVNRINQLVSDLLNSTRIDQLEFTAVNINNLVNEALEQAQDRLKLNRIRVEKYFDNQMCEIWVDKEKMKLAFLNIIVNAIEAMPNESGVLTIRISKKDDRCLIEFKDNGSGMDNETMKKLFEPYFTSKAKGNGLGLANTQNIILNHKGSINVNSVVGAGSTFSISLSIMENRNGK